MAETRRTISVRSLRQTHAHVGHHLRLAEEKNGEDASAAEVAEHLGQAWTYAEELAVDAKQLQAAIRPRAEGKPAPGQAEKAVLRAVIDQLEDIASRVEVVYAQEGPDGNASLALGCMVEARKQMSRTLLIMRGIEARLSVKSEVPEAIPQ